MKSVKRKTYKNTNMRKYMKKNKTRNIKKRKYGGEGDDNNFKNPDIKKNEVANKPRIELIDENNLTADDIDTINDYLKSAKYKNKKDIFSGVSDLFNNMNFVNYLKENKIFDKFQVDEKNKNRQRVKIVFYASTNKKNKAREYNRFKVFTDEASSFKNKMEDVDDMLSNIVNPSLIKQKDLYKRTIDIDITNMAKAEVNNKPKK